MKLTERSRILFLAANPGTTSRLDLEEELRSLEGELRAVEHRDQIDLIAAHAVRPDDVVRLLRREAPTVVHFSGHGSQGGIVLRGEQSLVTVSGPSLARVLGGRGIRLVVLNSCFSDLQAADLAAAVVAVVGTTARVGDEAARRFSTAFYRTLGDGYSVGEAFRDGRDAVDVHMLDDVFKMRGDMDLVLFGGRRAAQTFKTTADVVGVIGRLTPADRLVFRAVLKASSDIDTKVFREFFRAPNVLSGNSRDGYRDRLKATVNLELAALSKALRNLEDCGLIFGEELTDTLYRPTPEVVAIVNRSSDVILSLLYTPADIENRPIEVFYGETRFRDGKPDLFTDAAGVPLQGAYLLRDGDRTATYFCDGRIVEPTQLNATRNPPPLEDYVVGVFRALLAKLEHTNYFDLDPEQEIWKFGFESLKELALLCASAVVAAKTKRVPRDVRDSVSELHEHVKVLRGFQDSWRLFEIGKNGDWREVQRSWPELGRATAAMEAAKPVATRSKRLLSSLLEGA